MLPQFPSSSAPSSSLEIQTKHKTGGIETNQHRKWDGQEYERDWPQEHLHAPGTSKKNKINSRACQACTRWLLAPLAQQDVCGACVCVSPLCAPAWAALHTPASCGAQGDPHSLSTSHQPTPQDSRQRRNNSAMPRPALHSGASIVVQARKCCAAVPSETMPRDTVCSLEVVVVGQPDGVQRVGQQRRQEATPQQQWRQQELYHCA